MKLARFSSSAVGLLGAAVAVAACGAKAPGAEADIASTSAALTSGWTQVTTTPPMQAVATAGSIVWGISNGVAASYGAAGNDFDIYERLPGGSWVQQSGGAVQVAADPSGGPPWVVNHAGVVYKGNGSGGWTEVSSSPVITHIGVGGGAVWAIGSAVAESYGAAGTDFDIYELVNGAWVQQSGGADQVAVSSSGTPWVVNHAGVVYEGNGSGGWNTISSSPAITDIALGSSSIWAIGSAVAASYGTAGTDYDIYELVNGAWVQQSGGADQIAVNSSGIPWAVNHAGTVYEGSCDPIGCPAVGGACVSSGAGSYCESAPERGPSGCTANVPSPINPLNGNPDPVNGTGWMNVSCGGSGNGYYTVSFTNTATPGSWIGYSPYSAGTFQYSFLGAPIAVSVDEDDGYLPGPACQESYQCTIHATYVQVCAVPGAGQLTDQSGVTGQTCVTAPVTYQ